jgi:hypothetical protein
MHPVIALTIAQRRQAELIAESHSRVLSSTARPARRGLLQRIRRAIGEASYPAIELPTLTNYPFRP